MVTLACYEAEQKWFVVESIDKMIYDKRKNVTNFETGDCTRRGGNEWSKTQHESKAASNAMRLGSGVSINV